MADDAHKYELALTQAETNLRRLRALYDQWFQGVERVEPRTARDDMERALARLGTGQPRNTALRFRFNQLRQRFVTYNTYWKRIGRQIEEGTYKRDVLRAQRRRRPDSPRPEDRKDAVVVDVAEAVDADATRPSLPPGEISPFAMPGSKQIGRASVPMPPPTPGRTKTAARPRASAAGGGQNKGMQKLYERYVSARKTNGERVDNVSYDALMRSVKQMVPKLRAKHPGKRIGFEVVVRDGKVALKPIAK